MEKRIELIFSKPYGNTYLAVPIPEELKRSELAKIIGAEKIKEFDIHSGHEKRNDSLKDSEELVNREEYLVHTNNIDNTLELIKKYNHKN